MKNRWIILAIFVMAITFTGCAVPPDEFEWVIKKADVVGVDLHGDSDAAQLARSIKWEMKIQGEKFFRNYTRAKDLIHQLDMELDRVASTLQVKSAGHSDGVTVTDMLRNGHRYIVFTALNGSIAVVHAADCM